jgi:outer membrane receptor for monomeric catechols
LVGEGLALGARYSLSRAQLHSRFPDIPATAVCYGGFAPAQNRKATLQQANLYAVYNHPLGLFAGVEALWVAQDNAGYAPPLPGDEVWQFNAQLGYRFPRRQAELRLALLNLTDQNYRFNPLNLRSELPRARTLAVSFRMAF